MPKGPSRSSWRQKVVKILTMSSEWRGGMAVPLFLLGVALLTRTVGLSSFPYFPPEWPWNGINGLYADEYSISQLKFMSSAYFPFLQIILMGLAIQVLGYTALGIRLVSAIFSSATAVLVYLSAHELFHKRLPAFLSSLFFIFMTQALVLGRMAFVENGAATFFVATFFFMLKYLNTSNSRWLISSGICAGLSFLCKQTGIVATIFLVLFILIYKPEAKRHLLKPLVIVGIAVSAYIVQIMIVEPSYIGNLIGNYIFIGIGSLAWFAVLLFNLMPSGINLMWIESPQAPYKDLFRFATVDFWYIFAFFVIVYLVHNDRRAVRTVILALSSYVLVLIFIGHTNSYYAILAQPFMAIPFGYGLLKLQNMSGAFATAFSLLLCFPAVTYINYYVSNFLIESTFAFTRLAIHLVVTMPIVVEGIFIHLRQRARQRKAGALGRILLIYYIGWLLGGGIAVFYFDVIWVLVQFMVMIPLVMIGLIRLLYDEGADQPGAILVNRFLLLVYAGSLIIGCYLLSVFYPGYFAQSTVPT